MSAGATLELGAASVLTVDSVLILLAGGAASVLREKSVLLSSAGATIELGAALVLRDGSECTGFRRVARDGSDPSATFGGAGEVL